MDERGRDLSLFHYEFKNTSINQLRFPPVFPVQWHIRNPGHFCMDNDPAWQGPDDRYTTVAQP